MTTTPYFSDYDYVPLLWLPPSAYYQYYCEPPTALVSAAAAWDDYKWCSDTDDSEGEVDADFEAELEEDIIYGEYRACPYDLDEHLSTPTPRATPSASPIPSPEMRK